MGDQPSSTVNATPGEDPLRVYFDPPIRRGMAQVTPEMAAMAPHPIDPSQIVQGTVVTGMPVKSKCPFLQMQARVTQKPTTLNLRILNPPRYHLDAFDYAKAFQRLDLTTVKKDIVGVLRDSKDWWPADYGHYGPFMVRMAWHAAGTYRTSDGRGGANTGNQRFNPLDSWPDNGNLDKARRLLWPIKQKYGKALSWGDLFILTGNVAMEDMGLPQFGFGGGRLDCWAQEEDVYWGEPESFENLETKPNELENPLGAIVQGLIYVNPEGPGGCADPMLAAGHIRTTFGRMAMNDEETVALIAGGHTFGKCHGAAPGGHYQGPKPSDAAVEEQGFGWTSSFGSGSGKDTITSGLEGAWTAFPAKWDHGYFTNLFKYEWELTNSPGGAKQWKPKNGEGEGLIPDAHDPNVRHPPMMLTTDLSLIVDPEYKKISMKFLDNPEAFADAFARAWFKLCHRDMGPVARYLGPDVPKEELIWMDPIGTVEKSTLVTDEMVADLKAKLLNSGLTVAQMVRTAWASACTFRHTDFRGGANGARIRLQPQNAWPVNDPEELNGVILAKYQEIQRAHNAANASNPISMADLIVLAGAAGIEKALQDGGLGNVVKVPFKPGRGDATQEKTDVNSFAVLEPKNDAFRNVQSANAYQLVDRAHLLNLNATEMTVMVGGLRVLGANCGAAGNLGVLTNRVGVLSNDFFVNLLSMDYQWTKVPAGTFVAKRRQGNTQDTVWTASQVDLVFGSNPELRAIAEFYACADANEQFAKDFVSAWFKVMNNDRFD
mmetsp:Transcript_10031/g.24764  ORF Transcript_10031/g.24764 Transcript_10031/m.24764 type:complete len:773 (+) Transcript_10031:437-2755(+)